MKACGLAMIAVAVATLADDSQAAPQPQVVP